MFFESRKLMLLRLALIVILVSGLMGAMPEQAAQAATLIITNTNDSGPGSLRQAIADAAPGDRITFDSSLAGQTIALASDLTINKDLIIDGFGLLPQIIISGEGIAHLQISSYPTVTIKGLTIANAYNAGNGGAISSNSFLTVMNSTLRNNQSGGNGGGLSVAYLTIIDSTIRDNHAAGNGGAIFSPQVTTIRNTTIYRNQADGAGGAISSQGTQMIMSNSTVTQNQSGYDGGAIFMNSPVLSGTIENSTFVGNNADSGASELALLASSTLALGNTIFVCLSTSNNCYSASLASQILPWNSILGAGPLSNYGLAELADNGGPTETMALLPGSPLIDAGDDAVCDNSFVNNLDQRGVTRPQGGHCDIGSYEAEYRPAISGNTGVAGATLSYIDGTSKSITSDGNGNYSISLPVGWSGVVTPNKTGYTFTPANRTYNNLQSDQTSQNYTIQPTTGGADTTGVFRPSNGALYLKNKNETGYADVQINYGIGGDYPVVGDWDGNGTVTIGIYRNGSFYLRNENTIGFADLVFAFGAPGDQPVAGDWDGDGVDTIGVYRNGTFFLRNDNSSGTPSTTFALGIPGDVGIAGDWNGDGMDTTAVFRPSNGALYLKNQNTTGFADIQINYGIGGDKPVTGDWNNDGVDTIGVYRNGMFMLRNSNTIGFADIVFALGIPGDMPITGNWDGLP